MKHKEEKISVIIVGGGFGGVAVAKRLAVAAKYDARISVTLISGSKYFLFTPLLHEVATGVLRPDAVGESLAEIFKESAIELVYDRVATVNPITREIKTIEEKSIKYDYLVLSTGCKTNFFNIRGAEENTYAFKTLEDALKLKGAIHARMERSRREKRTASFAIIGGGPTGVEIASELACCLKKTFKTETPMVTIVEYLPELICMFPQKFRILAKERLEKIGVSVRLNKGVVEVRQNSVILDDKTDIPADLTVWTAGAEVDIPKIIGKEIALVCGRLPVRSSLQMEGEEKVFVIGDAAAFVNEGEKKPSPQLAQVAVRQGAVAARNITALIEGRSLETYRFVPIGLLLSLGEWMAIVQIKGLFLSGRCAWLLWRAIYLFKLETLSAKIGVLWDWIRNFRLPRRRSMD